MKSRTIFGLFAAMALLAEPPAASAEPAGGFAPPASCANTGAERAALQAERTALNARISDIAFGKSRKRRKPSGGEVAAGVAGTAASVLLPFGVGALLSAGAGAAAKSGRRRKPAEARADVPAMIDRLHSIDARLAALEGCGAE